MCYVRSAKLFFSLFLKFPNNGIRALKDLSKISFAELINALQAVDQRRTMRWEANEQVVDVAYLAKESKGKGKTPRCDHCKKI